MRGWSLTASFVPGLFRRPGHGGGLNLGEQPLPGVAEWFWRRCGSRQVRLVSWTQAGAQLRYSVHTALRFPQSPLAPRRGQAGTKRNHAPWRAGLLCPLPVTLGFPRALMAACLEHKNQEASTCAPEKCHLLLCKGCALHGKRPQAPSFLRRVSREAPPVGRSIPPVCVQHAAALTGRQAGRLEASSILGAQGASWLPQHSIPSCHVHRWELGAAGPDV